MVETIFRVPGLNRMRDDEWQQVVWSTVRMHGFLTVLQPTAGEKLCSIEIFHEPADLRKGWHSAKSVSLTLNLCMICGLYDSSLTVADLFWFDIIQVNKFFPWHGFCVKLRYFEDSPLHYICFTESRISWLQTDWRSNIDVQSGPPFCLIFKINKMKLLTLFVILFCPLVE